MKELESFAEPGESNGFPLSCWRVHAAIFFTCGTPVRSKVEMTERQLGGRRETFMGIYDCGIGSYVTACVFYLLDWTNNFHIPWVQ